MMKPSTSSSTSTEHGVGTNREPKYKGVRKRKWGKWVSEIRLPNSRERIWLGSYDSAEKAARAFDAALFCLRGRNAKFNFPQNPPEIAGGRSMSAQEIQEAAARFANEEVPRRSSNLSNSHNAAAAEQNSSSTPSSVVSDQAVVQVDTEVMDWSFLNMLDCNEGVSNYGLYDGLLGYMPGELYAPPSHQPQLDDNLDDQTGGETAFSSHSSYLWNF